MRNWPEPRRGPTAYQVSCNCWPFTLFTYLFLPDSGTFVRITSVLNMISKHIPQTELILCVNLNSRVGQPLVKPFRSRAGSACCLFDYTIIYDVYAYYHKGILIIYSLTAVSPSESWLKAVSGSQPLRETCYIRYSHIQITQSIHFCSNFLWCETIHLLPPLGPLLVCLVVLRL